MHRQALNRHQRRLPWRVLALALTLAVSATGMASAQTETGNLYGRTTDGESALPGVTVILSGLGADKLQVTNKAGEFRFLGLSPGRYELEATLEGFGGAMYDQVEIRIGRNVTLEVQLNPAIEETVVVTSEIALLDNRKITRGITVTQFELQKIPTARDPWAIAGQTPGVLMDRINVGGNESGQQPNFIGTGGYSDQNVFMIDGVNISDQAAIGASSTYFGFEQFEEMAFSTGGTDIEMMTPGVQISLVTKRGTNQWKGSASFNQTDGDWQASDNLDTGTLAPGQDASGGELTGNRIDIIEQYGAEIGGPLWQDHLWLWGAYDKNDIKQTVFGGSADNTELVNEAIKLNAQVSTANSFVALWNRGDKIKAGRGAAPTRPPETTWDQAGPSPMEKVEDTHVFNSNFFATASWSEMKGGFALEPNGGRDAQMWQDADGVYHGSYQGLNAQRPTETWRADAAVFFNTGNTSHELKFGASTRQALSTSNFFTPGTGVATYAGELFGFAPGEVVGYAWRERLSRSKVDQDALWVQDTLTRDRLTINAGLRYDIQEGNNLPSSVEGSPFGTLLPSLDYQGSPAAFTWKDVSPRLGVTYAIGAERKTLLRASYSHFVDSLGHALIEEVNPAGFSFAAYYGQDTNGNGVLDVGEPAEFAYPVGFTPGADPTTSPGFIDPNLEAIVTQELTFGVEHALRPDFILGLTLTLRDAGDYYHEQDLYFGASGPCPDSSRPTACVLTREDYFQEGFVTGNLPDGTPYSEPYYAVRDGLVNTGGDYQTNSGRTTDYTGLSFSAEKRLKDNWMFRGHFTYYDWTWDIDDSFYRFDDPTDVYDSDSDFHELNNDSNGQIVADQSGGSGSVSLFLNSRWSFNLSGLYELPYGFNVAANINGREGYPSYFYERTGRSNGGAVNVQVGGDPSGNRVADIITFDTRIDKDFKFKDFGFTVSLDFFNILNAGSVVQRENNLGSGRGGYLDQIIGPRVARLGFRLSWN